MILKFNRDSCCALAGFSPMKRLHAGVAAHHGCGRPPQLTGAAGNKRKAPDVLCTARNAADDNAAVRGHTTARAELTLKALKTSFQQQAGNLEAQIQEQSVTQLAGLTALDHDLKRNAKADYQDSCKQLEDANKLLDFVEAEWASDMKELEANSNSCVAAIRSSTTMLNRVQDMQGSFAQQLTQLLACNKVM